MTPTLIKSLRNALLDSRVSDITVIRLFCQIIRTYPHSKTIIDGLGLVYKHRSAYSLRKSDLARRIFRKVVLPRMIGDEALTSSFYAMLINPSIPNICLLAVINTVKKQGKDPWLMIRLAFDIRPLFVDDLFGYSKQVKSKESRH